MRRPPLAWHFPCGPLDLPVAHTNPLEALGNGCSSVAWRVRCQDTPDSAGRCRVGDVLWQYPAGRALREFAREAALHVAHLWHPPRVVLQYLKTGDPALFHRAGNLTDILAHETATVSGMEAETAATWSAAWASGDMGAWAAAEGASDMAAKALQELHQPRKPLDRRLSRRLGALLVRGQRLHGQRRLA